jgi:AcrR family transcriptional regulator
MNRAVREQTARMARPRAKIDSAALADAFSADGLHGTSSAAIAAAIGVAKPTLYVHGASKDALFLRAVEAEVERVLDRLHAAEARTAGRSARDCAAAAAQALLDHAASRPAGARLIAHTSRHGDSSVAAAVAAAVRRIPDRIEAGLRRDLVADGLDASLAPFLARVVHGACAALAEVRAGEARPARASLARLAASVVPEPAAAPVVDWPAA